MRKIYNGMLFKLAVCALVFPAGVVMAGNPDRAGQAGATELLINPWAQSTGWAGANSGSVHGLEAQFLNVAGTAYNPHNEFGFCHTMWMKGSGINLNAFGMTLKVGEAGVMGFSGMSVDFGDIAITTTDQPDGGLGTYTPQYINLALSYAKVFSNSIYGGMVLRIVNENISNVGAHGVAVDAGIQYVTGTNEDRDNVKFGIALKNVGTTMKFGGDGLSTRANSATGTYEMTVEQRAEGFEIPSLVNIGFTYDLHPAKEHRVSLAANFTSNSFTNDQYMVGGEYSYKEMFMLRSGFTYEKDLFDDNLRMTVFSGYSGGFGIQLPLGSSGKKFGIDYSFRATNPWDGTHSFGAKFIL
jgi:hypothetical protein